MKTAVTVVLLWGCDRKSGAEDPSPPSFAPPAQTMWPFDTDPDLDGDGYPNSADCGPMEPSIYPGAPERCNGIDDDCDGVMWYETDNDSDSYLACDECDDQDVNSHPGLPDALGDHIDTDCDGTDGQGLPMPEPLAGPDAYAWFGFSLAAGDLDTDGCAELAIGQPGVIYVPFNEPDSATLTQGCFPWVDVHRRSSGGHLLRGFTVDIAAETLLVHDRDQDGHLLLFDADSFRTGSPPLFEVLGEPIRAIRTAALLGEGPEWLIWGRQGGYSPNEAHYRIVSLPRTGMLDLAMSDADHIIQTDSQIFVDGAHVGDVGDRNGDGRVDLGFGQRWGGSTVHFFPEVASAHISDAPEVWSKEGMDTRWQVTGDVDLDGDGLDDALVADTNTDIDGLSTVGRVYVVPYQGDGEHDLLASAPARIDGERAYDWTGIGLASGDLDADGQADLVVGAPGSWDSVSRHGQVMAFLGPLAGVYTRSDAVAVWVGDNFDDHAGYSLAIADLDGSGHGDIAVGAPHSDIDNQSQTGAVYLLIDPL